MGSWQATSRSALHAGFSICRPHDEVTTRIDDHPVPRPLEEEDHLAAPRHHILQDTMRFESTTKVLAERMLKYYRISLCPAGPKLQWVPHLCSKKAI